MDQRRRLRRRDKTAHPGRLTLESHRRTFRPQDRSLLNQLECHLTEIFEKIPRRVVAKVEWHLGELYPRVGFIVTNLSRPAERVVAFYNNRGTAEQWIKEGKNSIMWPRLSCCSFAANAVRVQFHALAYNLANLMRTLALPEAVIADEPAGETREDRRQVAPWPLRHIPDGRGRSAKEIVPGDSAADRRTATKTGPSVGLGRSDASSRREECA
jgi:Transposase DDE domain group 1